MKCVLWYQLDMKLYFQAEKDAKNRIPPSEMFRSETDKYSQFDDKVCMYFLCSSPIYHQVSNIRRTESEHLKDSRSVLRLSLPNPLKPDVKSRMKM